MSEMQLIRPKREWVPEWLWRAVCLTMRPMILRWPLYDLLTRERTREEMVSGAPKEPSA